MFHVTNLIISYYSQENNRRGACFKHAQPNSGMDCSWNNRFLGKKQCKIADIKTLLITGP